ncbi:hypothetical protein HT136_11505 [Novosphingobium profundi]|uniref:hypothetical protein n=1 Tax=Novosphingobium profundi TaxID=1774954 RepID=UPI001BDAC9FC|nr:hypothetical protein [Novosphingobium profundi]MBT0668991.1 hypothetical protein [Novosphingobium profundi]
MNKTTIALLACVLAASATAPLALAAEPDHGSEHPAKDAKHEEGKHEDGKHEDASHEKGGEHHDGEHHEEAKPHG